MPTPRFRLRSRTLLALVACCAVGSWAWVTYLSPGHRWQRAIRSDNESAHRWEAASRAIAGKVPGVARAEAISGLGLALSDPSPRVRETAAWTLGQLRGPEARPILSGLAVALGDRDLSVRWRAAESLGAIAELDPEARKIAVPALLGALKDPRAEIRTSAGFWLSLMDRRESALPVLSAIVRQGEDHAGMAALGSGLCGSRDEKAVEALKSAALGSSSPSIRRASAEALARIAAPGPPSGP